MWKRFMVCLLTVATLLMTTASVMISPYDVNGDGKVTDDDVLLLFQYNMGMIEALPFDSGLTDVSKIDAVAAYREATNGMVKPYTETPRDELVSVTANFVTVAAKAGDTVTLPVYIHAADNPVLLLDIQQVVYDDTVLALTDVVLSEDVASTSRGMVVDDHVQILYNDPVPNNMIDLQFIVSQDLEEGMFVSVNLQGVSAVVEDDTEWAEATIDTEPGGIRSITREDLKNAVIGAQQSLDMGFYAADTIPAVTAAIEEAQAVLADPDASIYEIMTAFKALNIPVQM